MEAGKYVRNVGVNTSLGMSGEFDIKLWHEGVLVYSYEKKNLVVSTGENLAASRFSYIAPLAAPQYIAFGTGTTPAAKTQTALVAELGPRFAASGGSGPTLNQMRLFFSITGVTWNAVSEVGVFNANAAGVMVSRSVLAPFNVGPASLLEVWWTLTFLGVD